MNLDNFNPDTIELDFGIGYVGFQKRRNQLKRRSKEEVLN